MRFSRKNLVFWSLLGSVFLSSPELLAEPVATDGETAISPALETVCPDFMPITNSIEPTVAEDKTRPPDVPNSICAKDLAGIDAPVVQVSPVQETDPIETPSEIPPDETSAPEGWRIDFQPYITIPVTTYGQVEIKGKTVNYHLDTGELLDVLKVVVSGRVEAWNGNFGLIVDGYYANLGGSGITESNRPNIEATLENNLTFNQGIYDFAAGYHLGDRAIAYNPDKPSTERFPRFWFAPYIGTRLNDINSTIETTLKIPRRGRERQSSVSQGRTWFEPLIGGKVGLQISEPVTLWLRGDASGFDLAGDTDMSWNLIFGVDWWVHRQVSLQFAYRFYEINYGNGSGNNAFRFEENFNGPYLSATFRF